MNTNSGEAVAGASSKSINSYLADSDSDEGILSSYSLPTLSELTHSSKGQQSLLTRSQYALVVFHGVADTYPTDSDIVCRYSLTDGVEAAPGDRIVLFAVGWSSIKDYIVFDWAPIPEKEERDLAVVFKAADLPKDTNEFYQVCYVSNEGAVCGASVPFQVRIPNNDELTFALEEDMVVVRSSTAVAENKLLKAQLDREKLNKQKIDLEKQLCSLEDKHSITLRQLDRLQETLNASNSVNERLNRENAELRNSNSELLHTKEQLKEAQNLLNDAERDKKHMQEEIETLTAAAEGYKLTITNFEISAIQSEDRLIAAVEQTETLRKAYEKSQDEIVSTKLLENLRLDVKLKDLRKERNELYEQLRNAMQSKEINRTYFEQYCANGDSNNGRLIMENTKLLRTTEDLQLRISTLEQEKCTLEQLLGDTLDAQKCSCRNNYKPEERKSEFQSRLAVAPNDSEAVEEKEGCSSPDDKSSLQAQVETLTKWLDDSLKENQLHTQENMALRLQNEILGTKLAENNSKSNEYVLVSKMDNTIFTSQNSSVNQQDLTLKTENKKLAAQSDEFSKLLIEKDKELDNMHRDMKVLKNKFSETKKEFNLEINNLTSKNASLIEQERRMQELKNEMQRITFMNGELLAENASMTERVHHNEYKLSTKTEMNSLPKKVNSQSVDSSLAIENNQLRKQLEFAYENLNRTWKHTGTVAYQVDGDSFCHKDNKLVSDEKTTNSSAKSQCLLFAEKHDMLLQRLDRLHSKIESEHHREYSVEPKLKQISQNVENMLSVVRQLASCSQTMKTHEHCSIDAHELRHRLIMAREEYEKLHVTMVNYRTKYNELKTRYKVKKGAMTYDNVSA